MMFRHTLPLTLLVGMTACADQGDFPSLAKRPIESQSSAATSPLPPRVIQPVQPSLPIAASTVSRLADAVQRAESGAVDFQAALPAAQNAVAKARSAAFGSETWVAAQMALSALERAHAPVQIALADVDDESRIVFEQQPNADHAPLDEATARLSALSAGQNATIAGLISQLRSR
jgi:hypothetical protein